VSHSRRVLVILATMLLLLAPAIDTAAKERKHNPALNPPYPMREISEKKPAWFTGKDRKTPKSKRAQVRAESLSPPVGTVWVEYYGNQALIDYFYESFFVDLNNSTANMYRAPNFVFVDKQEKSCSQMLWPVPDRVYQICTMPYIAGANGLTWSNPIRNAALVQIENSAATWPLFPDIICHEMQHAAVNVSDGPFIYPDTSCVRGYLDNTGYWDRQNMWWWWG
jgi:hypothetical protein